jgi:hypothetical protein
MRVLQFGPLKQKRDPALWTTSANMQQPPSAGYLPRYALEQHPPDLDAARDGLLGGGNHPGDIPGMMRLFRYFQHGPYMATAIKHWRGTDPFLDQLASLGAAIHVELSSPPLPPGVRRSTRSKSI